MVSDAAYIAVVADTSNTPQGSILGPSYFSGLLFLAKPLGPVLEESSAADGDSMRRRREVAVGGSGAVSWGREDVGMYICIYKVKM